MLDIMQMAVAAGLEGDKTGIPCEVTYKRPDNHITRKHCKLISVDDIGVAYVHAKRLRVMTWNVVVEIEFLDEEYGDDE